MVLDPPPALNILTVSAVAASDRLIVPCKMDPYSLDGLGDLFDTIKEVSQGGPPVSYRLLMTQYESRNTRTNEAIEEALAPYREQGKVFDLKIRKNEAVNQAHAEEVRNLAQRSAESARNTAVLIDESQANADAGVKVAEEVSEFLREIEQQIGTVKGLVSEVATASGEQATGIAEIGRGVSQLESVTQSNAATAEESAAAGHNLNNQADSVRQVTGKLQKVVYGGEGQKDLQAVVMEPPATPRRQAPTPAYAPVAPAKAEPIRDQVLELDDEELIHL